MTDNNDRDMLHKANAQLFIVDMHDNPKLQQQWSSLLKNIKDKLPSGSSKDVYTEKYNIIANFLVNAGYNTTPDYVLNQLKVNWYENYQKQFKANEDSDKFAQALLGNPTLLAGWQAALKKVADGSKPTAADDFLKSENYSCNKNQVNISIRNNRNHKLSYWTGIYGNSVLTPQGGGDGVPGPIITIYSDREFGIAGYVVDWELCKVTYKDGVLIWKQDDFGTQPTEGKITFAQVTRAALNDAYVGNEFFGIITFKSAKTIGKQTYQGTYSIMGRIGKPQKDFSSHASIKTPPKVKVDTVAQIFKYISYIVSAMFLLQMIYSGGTFAKSLFSKDKTKPGEDLNDKIDEIDETTQTEIEQTPSPDQSDPIDSSGSAEGDIGDIPNEQLPPGEDLAQMEANAEKITEEGEMDQAEDSVPETQEGGDATTEAEADGSLEGTVGELLEL